MSEDGLLVIITVVVVILVVGVTLLCIHKQHHDYPEILEGLVVGKTHYLPSEWDERRWDPAIKITRTFHEQEVERFVLIVTDWDGVSPSTYEEWEVSEEVWTRTNIGDYLSWDSVSNKGE